MSASASISLTESQTFQALRTFLLDILPAGTEVVRAQINRTPEPEGADFIVMTQVLRERLSTNVDTYSDGYLVSPANPSVVRALQPTRVTIQLDVHGPASAENAQIITTLFRSEYATDQFTVSGFDVQPLFAGDPRQMPFINGEQQVETRWVIDAVLQVNPVVTVAQQFASALQIDLVEVDTHFPPTP